MVARTFFISAPIPNTISPLRLFWKPESPRRPRGARTSVDQAFADNHEIDTRVPASSSNGAVKHVSGIGPPGPDTAGNITAFIGHNDGHHPAQAGRRGTRKHIKTVSKRSSEYAPVSHVLRDAKTASCVSWSIAHLRTLWIYSEGKRLGAISPVDRSRKHWESRKKSAARSSSARRWTRIARKRKDGSPYRVLLAVPVKVEGTTPKSRHYRDITDANAPRKLSSAAKTDWETVILLIASKSKKKIWPARFGIGALLVII